MIPVHELLNKIKWDKRENPGDYVLMVKGLDKIVEIPYIRIARFEGKFMVIMQRGEEVEIPKHRIREVRRKGEIIRKRPEVKTT